MRSGWDYAAQAKTLLNIPCAPAYLQPFTRTRAFPSLLFPVPPNLGGPINLLSHLVGEQSAWLLFRGPVNCWRRDVLGLPPLPVLNVSAGLQNGGAPILYGFSSAVCPKPADWGEAVRITGYWFLPPPADWQAPPNLVDFLANGPPPVYVGFGSMVARDPAAMTDVVLRALRRTGRRGILIKGWGGLQPADVGDEIFLVDSLPHTWLFPQMAAVVHHGGAGTTAAGLRAGVPSILVPFFADQMFWGRQVARLGLGPSPIPVRDLTVSSRGWGLGGSSNFPSIRGSRLIWTFEPG